MNELGLTNLQEGDGTNIQSLSPELKVLWAKKNTVDGEQKWLPLVAHLIDTQKTINTLYNLWLSDAQRNLLQANCSEDDMQKLVKFLGVSHDIGKATPAFQTKPSFDGNESLDAVLIEELVRAGFSGLDSTKLSSAKSSPHAKAGEALLERWGVPQSIGAIIGGHHGKPLDETPYAVPHNARLNNIGAFTANYWQSDNNPVLQAPWQHVQQELFNFCLASSGFKTAADIPSVDQPQAIILEGLLIMSDWLASSESLNDDPSKPMFSLIDTDETLDDIDFDQRFQNAWNTWYASGWVPQKVSLDDDPYLERWSFHERPVQAAVTKALSRAVDPGLMICEAPMGMGKTELALVSAEQLAYQTGHNGLFFALPTQATSNAMFDRVEKWLNKLAEKQGAHPSIELMHGKAKFNSDFTNLPDASAIEADADSKFNNENSVVVNSWFSGKKSILDDFTVGTIDHLLLLALKQKHLVLRHLGLSKKVVVIDEAHAYDSYMNSFLYRALDWLGAYRVPVVILSATLPKAKRNSLLEAYYHGKFGKSHMKTADLSDVSPNWRESEAYPLVSLLDGKKLQQITDFPGTNDRSPLHIQVKRVDVPDAELIQDILAQIQAGGIAGVIVNTVKRAQALAVLVPKDVQLEVLHASFLAPERAKNEKDLQDLIGGGEQKDKKPERPDKMIVIGTQVIEQSLDLDFDILYSDIAPMDLLIQRAGRLHRHKRVRPKHLQQPTMVVTGIHGSGDYDKGSVAVYGLYLLMKTDAYLPAVLNLPTDISPLVQQVYNMDEDPQVDGIDKAKAKFESDVKNEGTKAETFQIAKPLTGRAKTLHGWLSRTKDNQGDADSPQAYAAVRDIQETIEVVLLKHSEKGDFLLDGRKLAACAESEIAEQVIRLPAVLTNYGHLTDIINELEKQTAHLYPKWQQSKWLKGALALTLDESNQTVLKGWHLEYSQKLGLSYRKEDEDAGK